MIDASLVLKSIEASQHATKWKCDIEKLYIENEMFRPVPSKDFPMSLLKFEPQGEITVYDFLQKFTKKFKTIGE